MQNTLDYASDQLVSACKDLPCRAPCRVTQKDICHFSCQRSHCPYT